jgi:probable addiction module antidote protein
MARKAKIVEKLTTYDPAEDIRAEEAVAFFMADAIETNDEGYIAHAREVVARARAMWPNQ